MSDEELSKTLNRYFREPILNHSNLKTLFTLVSEFAIKLHQSKFIQKVNSIADHLLTKDNSKTLIKRYFHIINQILEKDDKLNPEHRYKSVISNEIVGQFIIFLTKVLRFGIMDIFVDMKMWRKKLAKKIFDKAFDSMRAEALKELKVDLDKGFSEEQVNTLEKGYRKRDMTASDIFKYLNGLVINKDQNSEKEKSTESKDKRLEREKEQKKEQSENWEERSSGDEEEQENEGKARKRVKRDYDEETELTADKKKYEQKKSDVASQLSTSFTTSTSSSFPYEPRRQIEPIKPLWQYSNSYYQQQNHQQQQQHPQLQYSSTQYQNTLSVDPRYPYYYTQQQQEQQYPEQFYPIGSEFGDYRQNQQKKSHKIIEKLINCKNLYFHECKCCGMLLTTTEKYESHMSKHFLNSQKRYEQSHSKIEHSRKLTKPLMQTLDGNKMLSSNQKYIVPLSSVKGMGEVECLICSGEIKVQWNGGDLECWVYQDAVRGKRMGEVGVCHLECERIAEEFESDGKG